MLDPVKVQANARRFIEFLGDSPETSRIIAHKWRDKDSDGRELVCPLAAYSSAVISSAWQCPTDELPRFVALMLPAIDDNVSDEARWPIMRCLGDILIHPHFATLSDIAWRRINMGWRIVALREVMSHTQNQKMQTACETVIALCERAASGDEPSLTEWKRAAANAKSNIQSTRLALRAVGHAVEARAAVYWAAKAAQANRADAWDRMANAMLDVLVNELQKAEGK